MGYVLVSMKDNSKDLTLNCWDWRNLRLLLFGAGWKPMGAIGHWDINTQERILQPLNTDHERFQSYECCCFQLVREGDVQNMLEAARQGLSIYQTNPDGTFKIMQEIEESDRVPTTVGEACDYVRDLLESFSDFAKDGAFIID